MDDREQQRKIRHPWQCFATPRRSPGTSWRRAVARISTAQALIRPQRLFRDTIGYCVSVLPSRFTRALPL